MPTLEHVKMVRNHLLMQSDLKLAELISQDEINRWIKYRILLRDFFINKPADFDYEHDLIWPKTPIDIDELKRKASEGDAEAQKILEKEQANGTLY